MNKRKGISLVSMVLYVVLFFIFMTFAIAMSSNMNYRTLSEKGQILNNEEFEKLQYNLVNSAMNSSSVIKGSGFVSFSNGDVYTYDSENLNVLKNGGILAQNVTEFNTQKSYLDLIEVNVNAKDNINRYMEDSYACIDVKFFKYDKETYKQIFVSTRGDNYDKT